MITGETLAGGRTGRLDGRQDGSEQEERTT